MHTLFYSRRLLESEEFCIQHWIKRVQTRTKFDLYTNYCHMQVRCGWGVSTCKTNWSSVGAVQNITRRIVLGMFNSVSTRTVLNTGRLLSIFNGLKKCNATFVSNRNNRNTKSFRDSVRPGTARVSGPNARSKRCKNRGFDLVPLIFCCRRKRSRWRDTRRKNIRGGWWPLLWDCTCRWTRARWWTGPFESGAWPCYRQCCGRATTRKCCPGKTTGRRFCSVSTPEEDPVENCFRTDSFRTFFPFRFGDDLSFLYSPRPLPFRFISSFLVSVQQTPGSLPRGTDFFVLFHSFFRVQCIPPAASES